MRRSKLESYEAILEALLKRPLTVDRIAYKTNMDCIAVERHLDFLIKHGLAEERYVNDKTLYAITERGIAVFKTLNFQKYLQKVATSLRALDDALQVIPTISKINEKEENNQ